MQQAQSFLRHIGKLDRASDFVHEETGARSDYWPRVTQAGVMDGLISPHCQDSSVQVQLCCLAVSEAHGRVSTGLEADANEAI